MKKASTPTLFLIIILFVISGCNYFGQKPDENRIEHNLLMATFYTYYAAEYKALAYQAFNIASERLVEIRQQQPDADNLAVVVDIDETVLDNSPYEARMILDNSSYASETWDQWCNMAVADAVPGALGFLSLADSLNIHIFYLSNRKIHLQPATFKNIKALGFPQTNENNFLLRDAERSKEARRNSISENYNIVLLAGDNLGDFYTDTLVFSERDKVLLENKSLFGSKFIVLPNAMYGDWVSSIEFTDEPGRAKQLLEKMAEVYE